MLAEIIVAALWEFLFQIFAQLMIDRLRMALVRYLWVGAH
jgi:hypothetical protein